MVTSTVGSMLSGIIGFIVYTASRDKAALIEVTTEHIVGLLSITNAYKTVTKHVPITRLLGIDRENR